MKKLDMLKKIADMMANVLQKRKENITVKLPVYSKPSNNIYNIQQETGNQEANMYSMSPYALPYGNQYASPYYLNPYMQDNEPSIYDMPPDPHDIMRSRFRQFN